MTDIALARVVELHKLRSFLLAAFRGAVVRVDLMWETSTPCAHDGCFGLRLEARELYDSGVAVSVERLRAGEGERWRRIRLQALEEAPHAFGTTVAEASTWPPARWEQQVADFATFIAVVGGDDVGVARGAPHERADVRELIGMWVAPIARRQGIGARLIDVVADWAKADGANVLVLDVVEHNDPAIALYAGSGFELFEGDGMGVRADGETRMVKALRSDR